MSDTTAYTDLPTTIAELYRAAGTAGRSVDERQFSIEGHAILEVRTAQHIRNGTVEVLTGQGWRAVNIDTLVEHSPRNVPCVVVQITDLHCTLHGTVHHAYPEMICGRQWYRIEEMNPRLTHRFEEWQVQVLEGGAIPPEYR